MDQLKVLVVKLLAVDGLAAGTVARRKVTTLDHELLDHTVKAGALVVKGLAALSNPLLARTQGAEVLGRLWDHIAEELKDDAPGGLVVD